MAISELHTWGWKMEEELRPLLEVFLGEPLVKTERRWDAVDFTGATYIAELKCRRATDKKGRPITSKTYSDWLVPASKIAAAAKSAKRMCIFYYFAGDKTLWYLWPDKIDWATVPKRVPWGHTDLHYDISINLWTPVVNAYPGFEYEFSDCHSKLSESGDSCTTNSEDAGTRGDSS